MNSMVEVPAAAVRSFKSMHAATKVDFRIPHAPALLCSFFPKWLEQSVNEQLDELEIKIKNKAVHAYDNIARQKNDPDIRADGNYRSDWPR